MLNWEFFRATGLFPLKNTEANCFCQILVFFLSTLNSAFVVIYIFIIIVPYLDYYILYLAENSKFFEGMDLYEFLSYSFVIFDDPLSLKGQNRELSLDLDFFSAFLTVQLAYVTIIFDPHRSSPFILAHQVCCCPPRCF